MYFLLELYHYKDSLKEAPSKKRFHGQCVAKCHILPVSCFCVLLWGNIILAFNAPNIC